VAVGARIFVIGGYTIKEPEELQVETDIVYTFDTRQNVWDYHSRLPEATSDLACEYMELQNGKKVILILDNGPRQNGYLDIADEARGWQTDLTGSGFIDPPLWWEWRDIANLGRSVA
jgi:hypothetical protein